MKFVDMLRVAPPPASGEGKRNWERLEYQVALELHLSRGRCFKGKTYDVSLVGAFLKTAASPSCLVAGEAGEVHLVTGQRDALVLPCRVMRIVEQGVAIEFLGRHAAFGAFITHEMMLELLTTINNSFACSQNLEAALGIAVDYIQYYLQAEGAALFLVEEDRQTLVCRAAAGGFGHIGLTLGVHEGLVGKAIRDCLLQTFPNASRDASRAATSTVQDDDLAEDGIHSLICAPLLINGEAVGALQVCNKRGPGLFFEHDHVVLTALSSATSMAIHNARQAQELTMHRDKLEILVAERTADLIEANRRILQEMAERKTVQDKLQRAKEQAEEATRLKDQFVSLVAHDLRSPLGAILSALEYVVDDDEAPLFKTHRQLLENSLSSTRRLIQLIEKVLNISRFQTGKMSLEKKFFNVRSAVQETIHRLHHLKLKKRLHIDNAIPGDMRFFADRILIGEVLQNLLSNAIKFSQMDARIEIVADIPRTPDVVLTVRDWGVGIPASVLPKLFSIEQKTSTPGTHGEQGTGFGLPFSHDIMQAHEGSLCVTSHQGEGSAFSLSLPLVRPQVLIVADEPSLQRTLIDTLHALHVDVHAVVHGEEALARAQSSTIHLIVADAHTPVMDGFALLEALQRHHTTRGIAVMLMTVEHDVASRDRAFQLGAADCIVQPIQPHDVLLRVSHFVGG